MQSSNNQYLQFVGKPHITAVIAGGRRRVNYTFEDKSELVEEYDINNHELISRKWKRVSNIKESQWIYEVGEAPIDQQGELKLSNANPIFVRKDTPQHFQYRVRNLNYPEDVYKVEVDENTQEIVIRTSNKKYYKRFAIPDMRRANLKLEQGKVTHVYKNNTLIVSYPKPDQILEREYQIRQEFDKLNKKKPKEGDLECVQQ
ncbi:unnamed protein product (macronuclear) [Paramecium tetraurelia]|uniref:Protein DPCD n=1 Tax=Paramecium tetraurelia TaxID=5888 RepID=A0BS93_PARTE|nr:uncharacterized protein GSPATT00031641001 [Paramecium tetraurelia]CAK61410.1 unnamed protein product [Paramecium tetraurelia]|eukprot:XP_001428808.1 hypothetical protein (macronuclear) [Paramecium tetraurelia strain d4-2]